MKYSNPKVTIFFLAFFLGFCFSDSINISIQFYVLAAIIYSGIPLPIFKYHCHPFRNYFQIY